MIYSNTNPSDQETTESCRKDFFMQQPQQTSTSFVFMLSPFSILIGTEEISRKKSVVFSIMSKVWALRLYDTDILITFVMTKKQNKIRNLFYN